VDDHLLRERPELAERCDRFFADVQSGVVSEASERALARAEMRLAREAVAAHAAEQTHATDHVITDRDLCDVGSDLFDYARSLMTEDRRQ
jgi:hypothetical protein